MKVRQNDVSSTFKTSIREAKGIVNKRNNEVEVKIVDFRKFFSKI